MATFKRFEDIKAWQKRERQQKLSMRPRTKLVFPETSACVIKFNVQVFQ